MTLPAVEFSAEAAGELREAKLWYWERSPKAALAFAAEVDAAVERIVASPEWFAHYSHGMRRCVLRRFPYVVVFRHTRERIEIIAFAHTGRDEGYWENRVPSTD